MSGCVTLKCGTHLQLVSINLFFLLFINKNRVPNKDLFHCHANFGTCFSGCQSFVIFSTKNNLMIDLLSTNHES